MSIASEILRLQSAKANIKSAIEAKGVTVPASTTLDGYDDLISQISGGGGFTAEELANKTVTGVLDFGTATTIRKELFRDCTGVTGIIGNYITSIEENAFRGTRIVDVYLPELTSIGGYGIADCLGDVYLPKLSTIANGAYLFSNSPGSQEGHPAVDLTVVLPSVSGSFGADVFRQCRAKYIDLGAGLTALGNRTFYQAASDTVVIFRSPQVVTASASNCIAGIQSGWKIYVPSSLVSSYESDTNWSTKGNIFYAIEGSQFENAYADGRPLIST